MKGRKCCLFILFLPFHFVALRSLFCGLIPNRSFIIHDRVRFTTCEISRRDSNHCNGVEIIRVYDNVRKILVSLKLILSLFVIFRIVTTSGGRPSRTSFSKKTPPSLSTSAWKMDRRDIVSIADYSIVFAIRAIDAAMRIREETFRYVSYIVKSKVEPDSVTFYF